MPYCRYCQRLYDRGFVRKATPRTVNFMRQFTRYHNLSIHDDICVWCIENGMQVDAQQRHKIIVYDETYIVLDDEFNNGYNNAAHYGYHHSTERTDAINLRLQYAKNVTSEPRMITARFSLDTTLEIVIKYLISELILIKSCEDIVLTNIVYNEVVTSNIVYTLATTLRQLDVNENAFLRFMDSTEEHGRHRDVVLKPSTVTPSLTIRVHYSIYNIDHDYQLPYDTTVEYLVSAVVQSFHLFNIDLSRLQLTTMKSDLFINTRMNRRLIDLGIGTKYQLLFLSIGPEKLSPKKTVSGMLHQVAKLQKEHFIKLKSPLLKQTLYIDLLTIRTLFDLKQKFLDQYRKETQRSLHPNDICVSFNDLDFSESDDVRFISDLRITNKTELHARFIARTNKSLAHSEVISENNRKQASSHIELAQSEVNKYPLLRRTHPVGLYNLGNTCFLNSALQCLSHVMPLTLFILYDLPRLHASNRPNPNQIDSYGKVTDAYRDFLWNMWLGEESSFSPDRLRHTLGRLAPQFSTYDQQDAQELMVFLLNTIHNELQNYSKDENTIIKDLFFNTIQSTTTCTECQIDPKITSNVMCFLPVSLTQHQRSFEIHFIPSYGNISISHLAVPANGTVQDLLQAFVEENRLQYRRLRVLSRANGDEQYSMEKLLCEILDDKIFIIDEGSNSSSISRMIDHLTLHHCIRQFVTPETIEKHWLCKNECDGKYAVKEMQLKSLARVLIVQLKRFTDENGYMRKIDTYVDFPTNGFDVNQSNEIYDLIAVSNHMGSVHGGHYTAYARQNVNEPWYLFNDSRVTLLHNEDGIVSRNAYILVYLRREQNEYDA